MNTVPAFTPGALWRRYDNKIFKIVAVAKHSDAGELYVVYQHMGENPYVCAKELSLFLAKATTEESALFGQTYQFEAYVPGKDAGHKATTPAGYNVEEDPFASPDDAIQAAVPSIMTGIYRHYKNGFVEVILLCSASGTEDFLVLYRLINGDGSYGIMPLESFIGFVDDSGTPCFEPWQFN